MEKAELVENLCQVFSKYRFKPDFINRCSPLTPPTEEEYVALCKPLKELSEDDLGRLPHKVMTTWGDEEDFKHFLPRIVELSVLNIENDFFEDQFFFKIEYSDFNNWSLEERQPIYEAVSWYLKNHLSGFSNFQYLPSYFNKAIELVGIEKLKRVLMDDKTINAAYLLAYHILNPFAEFKKLADTDEADFANWINSAEVRSILQKGLTASDDENIAYTIQIALNNVLPINS